MTGNICAHCGFASAILGQAMPRTHSPLCPMIAPARGLVAGELASLIGRGTFKVALVLSVSPAAREVSVRLWRANSGRWTLPQRYDLDRVAPFLARDTIGRRGSVVPCLSG